MERATWHFVDEYDQEIIAYGRCSRGMKHGFFEFYIDGYQIARTKYTRDQEMETLCYANGNRLTNLRTCMIDNVRKTRNVDMPREKQKPKYTSSWDKSPWD